MVITCYRRFSGYYLAQVWRDGFHSLDGHNPLKSVWAHTYLGAWNRAEAWMREQLRAEYKAIDFAAISRIEGQGRYMDMLQLTYQDGHTQRITGSIECDIFTHVYQAWKDRQWCEAHHETWRDATWRKEHAKQI